MGPDAAALGRPSGHGPPSEDSAEDLDQHALLGAGAACAAAEGAAEEGRRGRPASAGKRQSQQQPPRAALGLSGLALFALGRATAPGGALAGWLSGERWTIRGGGAALGGPVTAAAAGAPEAPNSTTATLQGTSSSTAAPGASSAAAAPGSSGLSAAPGASSSTAAPGTSSASAMPRASSSTAAPGTSSATAAPGASIATAAAPGTSSTTAALSGPSARLPEKPLFPAVGSALESCRERCLREVAEGPRDSSNASISSNAYVKVLAEFVKKALYGMHPDDLQELLQRARYDMDKRYSSDSNINSWFSKRISSYVEYREKERSLQCDQSMWQADGFRCPDGFRGIVGIQMIHLERDDWKVQRVQRSACMQGFDINWPRSIWPGVNGFEHPEIIEHAVAVGYIKDPKGQNLGDVGAALGHITLLEGLQSRIGPTDIVLVMEDNAFFNPESVSGMCSSIKAAGDFDFLGLTVLRPKGNTISKDLGLRRVTKAKVQEPMPNVWLSSYLVTGAGAAKLLKCIKSQRQNYASKIIDRVLSQQCLSGDKSINAFVIDHHRFFGHSESGGDSRKKLNSKRPSNSTR